MNGYKTYALAAVAVILGLLKGYGFDIPGIEDTDPGALVLSGLAAAGLRHGIAMK